MYSIILLLCFNHECYAVAPRIDDNVFDNYDACVEYIPESAYATLVDLYTKLGEVIEPQHVDGQCVTWSSA